MGIAGVILIADYVDRTATGKYVIAGTYTDIHITVPPDQMGGTVNVPLPPLNLYVRFAPERPGPLKYQVRMVPGNHAPWDNENIFEANVESTVAMDQVNLPAEQSITISGGVAISLTFPARGEKPMHMVSPMRLELLIDGELAASAPLIVHCREHVQTTL
jgi:hypothetical protein